MPGKIGPLLTTAIERMNQASDADERVALAARYGNEDVETRLPVVIKLPTLAPSAGEGWRNYRSRVTTELSPLRDKLRQLMGIETTPLLAGNALQASVRLEQINQLGTEQQIVNLELDPLLPATLLDDVTADIEMADFQQHHPSQIGGGVKVAVLDSGIDLRHPHLHVAHSISTCGESVDLPGQHGTHCAGILASQDTVYPGIAPGVELLNVKVLRANGSGRHTDITKGIDEALDLGAKVMSMSVGFNHLPSWSDGGHGWSCDQGQCPLCTAVDNAMDSDGAVIVAAAGNEHERAETLRGWGYGSSFDTELACPGQARAALTVGALTKRTFLAADFSSRGPTAYGTDKPTLSAYGVNVTSTVPVPRDANGTPILNSPRSLLFGRLSGTSMATPMVAGAAALLIALRQAAGQAWTPTDIKQELLTSGLAAVAWPANVAGAGRLLLKNL